MEMEVGLCPVNTTPDRSAGCLRLLPLGFDMNSQIIDTEALRSVTGYKRSSDIERCLEGQGIRYFYGKQGPWTTLDLINASKGLAALHLTTSGDIL